MSGESPFEITQLRGRLLQDYTEKLPEARSK